MLVEDLGDGQNVHIGSFQVESGGDLDIDFAVYNAADKRIYSKEGANEEHFQLETTRAGRHKFCFENQAVSRGRKKVVFAIHRGHGELLSQDVATRDHLKPIEDMILTLSDKILRLKEHESYLKHRSSRHQKTTESTQSRVLFSTIIEGVVLITLNCGKCTT